MTGGSPPRWSRSTRVPLTTEAFEYTGGLRVGDPVAGRGQPLSARLGPSLLGSIFDGLLRPLADRPVWLAPGSLEHRQAPTQWTFEPAPVRIGSEVAAGTRLGSVAVGDFEHRVLVPPGAGGPLRWLAGSGEVDDEEPIATVGDLPVTLVEECPVRQPRPVGERLRPFAPLVSGQRVIDLLFPIARGGQPQCQEVSAPARRSCFSRSSSGATPT